MDQNARDKNYAALKNIWNYDKIIGVDLVDVGEEGFKWYDQP